MSKISPQRILNEAIRILSNVDNNEGQLVLLDVEEHEIDDVIEELELLIKSLNKVEIINLETPA